MNIGWAVLRQSAAMRYFALAVGKAGAGGVNLLAFMLLAASVSVSEFSDYAVSVALVSILAAGSEAAEYAYVRCIDGKTPLARALVALEFTRIKLAAALAFVLAAVSSAAICLEWPAAPGWLPVFAFACLQGLGTVFTGALTSVLIGEDRQAAVSRWNLGLACLSLGAVAAVHFTGWGIRAYLAVSAAASLAAVAAGMRRGPRDGLRVLRFALRRRRHGAASARGFRAVYRPVLGAAVLSVVKNHAIVLVLGRHDNDAVLAAYALAKRIFDFAHKGMAGFLDQLYIRAARLAERDAVRAERGVLALFGLRILFAAACAAILLAYFRLTGVGTPEDNLLCLAIVGTSFVLMYFVTMATLIASKNFPGVLFWNSVWVAIVYAVVPLAVARLGSPHATAATLPLCAIVSGLPLCLRAFGSQRYRSVSALCLACMATAAVGAVAFIGQSGHWGAVVGAGPR